MWLELHFSRTRVGDHCLRPKILQLKVRFLFIFSEYGDHVYPSLPWVLVIMELKVMSVHSGHISFLKIDYVMTTRCPGNINMPLMLKIDT